MLVLALQRELVDVIVASVLLRLALAEFDAVLLQQLT